MSVSSTLPIAAVRDLARTLCSRISAVGLGSPACRMMSETPGLNAKPLIALLRKAADGGQRSYSLPDGADRLTSLPLSSPERRLMGILYVREYQAGGHGAGPQNLIAALEPLCRLLIPVLAAVERGARSRSAALEWLFDLSGQINVLGSDQDALVLLVQAGAQRLQAPFAALDVSARKMMVRHEEKAGGRLSAVWQRLQVPLTNWASRGLEPLILNRGRSVTHLHSLRFMPNRSSPCWAVRPNPVDTNCCFACVMNRAT